MILRKELFWEYDVAQMDLQRDQSTIIPRVAMRGNVADLRFLLKHYSRKQLLDALLNVRYLDKYTLSLFSMLLDAPKDKFRCYRQEQSAPNYWNF
ncbi:MAG: hypothetical protein KBF73_02405 [Flavobacteriales bacterium]|nr:hypothetical protein [Flavobacteriales bacterium]